MSSAENIDPELIQLANELSIKYNQIEKDEEFEDITEAERMFNIIYDEFPINYSKAVSRKERERNDYSSTTLVYGEINFRPFADVSE